MSSGEKVTGIFRKERMFFSLFSSTPNTSFNLHNGPLQLFFDLRRRQGGPICLSSKFLNKLITSEVNWRNSCCNLSGQNAILSTKTFPTRVAFNEQEENNDLKFYYSLLSFWREWLVVGRDESWKSAEHCIIVPAIDSFFRHRSVLQKRPPIVIHNTWEQLEAYSPNVTLGMISKIQISSGIIKWTQNNVKYYWIFGLLISPIKSGTILINNSRDCYIRDCITISRLSPESWSYLKRNNLERSDLSWIISDYLLRVQSQSVL